MNQSELIDKVAQATALSQAAAGQAVKAVVNAILASLVAGEVVRVSGLGTFDVAARPRGAKSTKRRDHQNRSQQSGAVPCRQGRQRCAQSAESSSPQEVCATKEDRGAKVNHRLEVRQECTVRRRAAEEKLLVSRFCIGGKRKRSRALAKLSRSTIAARISTRTSSPGTGPLEPE